MSTYTLQDFSLFKAKDRLCFKAGFTEIEESGGLQSKNIYLYIETNLIGQLFEILEYFNECRALTDPTLAKLITWIGAIASKFLYWICVSI